MYHLLYILVKLHFYLLGKPLGKCHKIKPIKTLSIYIRLIRPSSGVAWNFMERVKDVSYGVSWNSWWWPDKPKYIYWVLLLFKFCDTYIQVPLISMNTYHLEVMPESYNLKLHFDLYYSLPSKWFQNKHLNYLSHVL